MMPAITFPSLLFLLLHCAVLSTSTLISYKTYTLPNNTVGPAYISINYADNSALTGISNGRVVKFSFLTKTFTSFSSIPNRNGTFCDSNTDPNNYGTCGRPFGIAYNRSGYVYFCDAYKGLFGVGPSGGPATPLVEFAGGLPVFFCNAVETDQCGTVYFTDTSQNFRDSSLAIRNRDATGRFIRYVPSTGQVTVLATGLYTPTGIALSSDNSYALVSQLGNNILKYYLTGPSTGTVQAFASIFGPANVRRSLLGDYFYVPQTPVPYIHYLIKINSAGVVVGNVSIAGPYSTALYYRDARPFLPPIFLIGSQFPPFLGEATIPGF
ncbi:hypothetical protein MLD38_012636 [Melastoma candidum]|uniref:Uncharacterized protein n=1 Tax=Melastoma candidum TaxID=119954 RepID=A0ACB9R737_9MYRT|nr:hypothetical protein MLD38_012636 [Melastoma candidum]